MFLDTRRMQWFTHGTQQRLLLRNRLLTSFQRSQFCILKQSLGQKKKRTGTLGFIYGRDHGFLSDIYSNQDLIDCYCSENNLTFTESHKHQRQAGASCMRRPSKCIPLGVALLCWLAKSHYNQETINKSVRILKPN